MEDFFSEYFKYTEQTESPAVYHRWCAITSISAILGRNFYLKHGHFKIYPNLYTMLIGDSGSRKSTSIKLAKKLLTKSGYNTIAADKTSKEKFLVDLEGREDEFALEKDKEKLYDKVMSGNLWGDDSISDREPKEVFIMADEFNEFSGSGNLEFYTTLGNLWDWDDEIRPFSQRLKNSRSVSIFQPTINILGGNTPENYTKAFPPEIIGQGFLSRMIHVYGERNGKRLAFPKEPSEEETKKIVTYLSNIRSSMQGEAELEEEAEATLEHLYLSWNPLSDVRFKSYSNRRFTQLLKICLVVCASRLSKVISKSIVVEANTILSAVEIDMPRSLGEFGNSINSEVTHKIMDMLNETSKPLSAKELWVGVYRDMKKITDLNDVMQNLAIAGRVQLVKGKGWLPLRVAARELLHVDWSMLTEDERKGI